MTRVFHFGVNVLYSIAITYNVIKLWTAGHTFGNNVEIICRFRYEFTSKRYFIMIQNKSIVYLCYVDYNGIG